MGMFDTMNTLLTTPLPQEKELGQPSIPFSNKANGNKISLAKTSSNELLEDLLLTPDNIINRDTFSTSSRSDFNSTYPSLQHFLLSTSDSNAKTNFNYYGSSPPGTTFQGKSTQSFPERSKLNNGPAFSNYCHSPSPTALPIPAFELKTNSNNQDNNAKENKKSRSISCPPRQFAANQEREIFQKKQNKIEGSLGNVDDFATRKKHIQITSQKAETKKTNKDNQPSPTKKEKRRYVPKNAKTNEDDSIQSSSNNQPRHTKNTSPSPVNYPATNRSPDKRPPSSEFQKMEQLQQLSDQLKMMLKIG